MFIKRKLPLCLLLQLTITVISVKTQTISDSLNKFAIDLLSTTKKEPGCPPNVAMSPYTVWSLLSIIDEGARGNTAEELERVLGIPNHANKQQFRKHFQNMSRLLSNQDSEVTLDIFNKIYTNNQQKLKLDFQKIAEENYEVKVEPTDFRDTKYASKKINEFVRQATNYRINNLINPSDLTDAYVFILSTLYFKGAWQSPFNRSATRVESFYDENENEIGKVDMMFQMGFFPFTRLQDMKGYAVELPYGKGDTMSMILILPYKHETVANILSGLKNYPFEKVLSQLDIAKEDFEGEDVKVYLPRFRVQSDFNLNVVLEKMGIKEVFDYAKADLLRMFPHYLYVSRIIQKAEIDVNEEGTVASAAAGGTLANKSPPPKFQANKPFLYFIVNKVTRSIVFEGIVSEPPQSPSE